MRVKGMARRQPATGDHRRRARRLLLQIEPIVDPVHEFVEEARDGDALAINIYAPGPLVAVPNAPPAAMKNVLWRGRRFFLPSLDGQPLRPPRQIGLAGRRTRGDDRSR